MQSPFVSSLVLVLFVFTNGLASLDTATAMVRGGYDDLAGVRIDTASAVKDFEYVR